MIDLDHNATTRPSPAVCEAVARGLAELWQNPSSVHRPGLEARAAVELARDELAGLLRVRARDVTLTGSGTEAIDLAIRGVLGAGPGGPGVLVTDDVEHAAVRDLSGDLARDGVEVRRLPIDADGRIDPDAVGPLLEGTGGRSRLVSVQWANNETGVIQPIARVHEACRGAGVWLHCDGTQWVGKERMPEDPPCDLLTCSPHKFHGPKGVGVLWTRRGVRLRPRVLGSQELGRRGGTENVPGILGAGVAASEARAWLEDPAWPDERARLAALRDGFERDVLARCPGAVVNSAGAERLWNTSNIGFPRLEAEALLMLLSDRGVFASAGAACSSGSLDPSPVLLAMGVDPVVAHGSVRFSMGRGTTAGALDEAARIVGEVVARLAGSTGAAVPGP